MEYCIGIDLGGTNIAGGVATLDGRLVHTQSVKTGMPCTLDEIADRIAALCRSLAQAAQTPLEQMAWIGVGAPGSVDKDTGVVEYANNLEFYNVPLGAMPARLCGQRRQCGGLGRIPGGRWQGLLQYGDGDAGHGRRRRHH